ncbi:acyltransferase family protein [Streptomyces sp. CS62]|uniref:acyltransferase family protein n=1 Tax=Streptomyces sp. CS62 TaxID=3119268 RepID=UPI002F956457
MADAEGRFTLFRNRAMVWLGDISFAFYLVHYTVMVALWKLLGSKAYSVPEAVALAVLFIAAGILASWALYALVERPITRRWSNPRRKPAVVRPTPEPLSLATQGAGER